MQGQSQVLLRIEGDASAREVINRYAKIAHIEIDLKDHFLVFIPGSSVCP
jgi:hypothetical protein